MDDEADLDQDRDDVVRHAVSVTGPGHSKVAKIAENRCERPRCVRGAASHEPSDRSGELPGAAPRPRAGAGARGAERVAVEPLDPEAYLDLYRRVGRPVRWDLRLRMAAAALATLLQSDRLRSHVLRADGGAALGCCEFDRQGFPDVELKNIGVAPAAQGRALGSWLLAQALLVEWPASPARIWLHTDTWDHPAALAVYRRAGFVVYDIRDEPPDDLQALVAPRRRPTALGRVSSWAPRRPPRRRSHGRDGSAARP